MWLYGTKWFDIGLCAGYNFCSGFKGLAIQIVILVIASPCVFPLEEARRCGSASRSAKLRTPASGGQWVNSLIQVHHNISIQFHRNISIQVHYSMSIRFLLLRIFHVDFIFWAMRERELAGGRACMCLAGWLAGWLADWLVFCFYERLQVSRLHGTEK